MPFHFSLASALRYRASLERREYLALQQIQQLINVVDSQLSQLEESCAAASRKRVSDMMQRTYAVLIQADYEHQSALERQRDALRAKLGELKLQWQQQLQAYQLAQRNQETLEKLRSRELDAYKKEGAKREQNAVDEIFLLRRRSK